MVGTIWDKAWRSKMALASRAKGFFFLFAFATVLYLGSIFFLPSFLLLLLLPWGVQISDKAHNFLASTFFKLVPGLLEVIFGVRVKICGDGKKLKGPCLLIMNHRTRFDWLFLWCYLIRMGDLTKLKIVLKESLKRVPVLGWSMQSIRFIFLSRTWSTDEKLLKEGISCLSETDFPLQLLFFPEGTDLSPANKKKGHSYAVKNDLPKYEYVLHPRTKGFCLCVEELLKYKTPPTLVNISVGYVGPMPQNERHISAGVWPTEIHFHAKQEPLASLPSGEEELTQWLKRCWQGKEKELRAFYAQKRFSATYLSDAKVSESFGEMKKIILLWTFFLLYIGYNCLTNSFYWYYFPIFTTFYMSLGYVSGGVDRIFLVRSRLFTRRS